MTQAPVVILGLLNLALIGALPRIFFRRGHLTAAWWLTATPFFASAIALAGAVWGLMEPAVSPTPATAAAAVTLHAASILLIGYTLGTHREPLSLWHQPDDTPGHVVTHGAYARIRHPFYAAFLLALLAAAVGVPHWSTVGALVLGLAQLSYTAAREEARMLASPLGARYRAYHARTGRFLPRLRAPAPVDEPRARDLATPADPLAGSADRHEEGRMGDAVGIRSPAAPSAARDP